MRPNRIWTVSLSILGLSLASAAALDDIKMKFADCPPAVRKALQAESSGAKIDSVTRERDDDNETIYRALAVIDERTYEIGVFEDGTLGEMSLAVDDQEVPFDKAPAAVRETFQAEAYGQKVEAVVKEMKYGVTLFEAVVKHKGKSYEVSVAEDGTLYEKVLVIDDEVVDLAHCPAAVQASMKKQAEGGIIHDVTRSTGIGRNIYEAEVEIRNKVYLVEVDEAGLLISKTLDAGEE